MQILIITTEEQIKALIADAVKEAVANQPKKEEPEDRCSIEGAQEVTGMSLSKIYKLTSTNQIPHRKFGQKLIFSRKALKTWMESKTVDRERERMEEIRKSARGKMN